MDKFNFSFKNRDVTFHKLCLFAKKTNLDELLITNGYVRIFRKLTTFDAWYISSEVLKVV